MRDELKPCPFCGGEAEITKWHEGYFAECKKQHCGGTIGAYKTEEEAIEAWNKRSERTCKVTPSKNLQGIVVCECGEPFPEYYDYCPYCGAKVVE